MSGEKWKFIGSRRMLIMRYSESGMNAVQSPVPGIGSADRQQSVARLLAKVETVGRMLDHKRGFRHVEARQHSRRGISSGANARRR